MTTTEQQSRRVGEANGTAGSDSQKRRADVATYSITPLTRALCRQHLELLMEMDQDTMGEPWLEEHWMLPMPGKWELSQLLLDPGGRPRGFIVLSIKPWGTHAHRMVVDPDVRGSGQATRLMRAAARASLERGHGTMSLKVETRNKGAIAVFEHLGFQPVIRRPGSLLMSCTCVKLIDA